jgi:hypothetical protein
MRERIDKRKEGFRRRKRKSGGRGNGFGEE